MTNKFLSRYVDKIAICFPDVASFSRKKNNFDREPAGTRSRNGGKVSYFIRVWLRSSKTVVLFGGSRGALKINQAFEQAFPLFEERVSSFIRFRRKILSGTSRKSKAF